MLREPNRKERRAFLRTKEGMAADKRMKEDRAKAYYYAAAELFWSGQRTEPDAPTDVTPA